MEKIKNELSEAGLDEAVKVYDNPLQAAIFSQGILFAIEWLEQNNFIPATLEEVAEEVDVKFKPLAECPLPLEANGQVTLQQLQEVKDQAEGLLNKIQDLHNRQLKQDMNNIAERDLFSKLNRCLHLVNQKRFTVYRLH